MKRWSVVAALSAVALAGILSACGSDGRSPTDGSSAATARGEVGSRDTTTQPPVDTSTPPTSNGPVVSLTILPDSVRLPLGYYTTFRVLAFDSQGARVAKPVSWSSSNPAVAPASDTGLVYGKALGVATIYATVDQVTDSARVTVVEAPTQPNPPTPQPVSRFNLTIYAVGLAGSDTLSRDRIAGATVTLVRGSDSLMTSVDVGTAVTDSSGQAVFEKVPAGAYSVRVKPPTGSPYLDGKASIPYPQYSDVYLSVWLRRP